MGNDWLLTVLGEHIETLKGYAFKSKWYQEQGIPVARVSNFTENSISTDGMYYVSKEIASDYKRYELRHHDVIIQTVGSWQNNPASVVGKVVHVPKILEKALLNQNAVKIIPKDSIEHRFLYYLLKANSFTQHNLNHAQGAANQASITLDSIKRFKFRLPPLPTQKKIAAILSAYDDLIENNLERIELLEEQAQLTYEEWFVRMKFPEYKDTPIDSETGLPEGWTEKYIGDICKVTGGGTPSKVIKEYWEDGNVTWFSPTDLSKSNSLIQLDSSKKITSIGLQKSSATLLQPDSFMMTSRATIGLFGIIDKPFSTNQGFINITPKRAWLKEFLLYSFKFNLPLFLNYATGATFQEISKKTFKKITLVYPSENLIKSFHMRVSKNHEMMLNLSKQNQLLKEARDILLPRLMTGMIEV